MCQNVCFGEQGGCHFCIPCVDGLRSLLVLSLACCITSQSIFIYHILIYHYWAVSDLVWILLSLVRHLRNSKDLTLFTSPCTLGKCVGCPLLTFTSSKPGLYPSAQFPQPVLLSHAWPSGLNSSKGRIMEASILPQCCPCQAQWPHQGRFVTTLPLCLEQGYQCLSLKTTGIY